MSCFGIGSKKEVQPPPRNMQYFPDSENQPPPRNSIRPYLGHSVPMNTGILVAPKNSPVISPIARRISQSYNASMSGHEYSLSDIMGRNPEIQRLTTQQEKLKATRRAYQHQLNCIELPGTPVSEEHMEQTAAFSDAIKDIDKDIRTISTNLRKVEHEIFAKESAWVGK